MLLIVFLLYTNLGTITNAIIKHIIAPIFHRNPSRFQQPNVNAPLADVAGGGGGDRLTGSNIERLLAITEQQSKLLAAAAATSVAAKKSESSRVEVLRPSPPKKIKQSIETAPGTVRKSKDDTQKPTEIDAETETDNESVNSEEDIVVIEETVTIELEINNANKTIK